MATCYRHPNRETGVSCSNCGNPICPDCMTATPVGMRCPDCARQRTPTRTLQSLAVDPIATYVLIALNVLIFVGVPRARREHDYSLFALGPLQSAARARRGRGRVLAALTPGSCTRSTGTSG